MKNLFIVLIILILQSLNVVKANTPTEIIPVASPSVLPYTQQTNCIQAFPINSEKLYLLTLAAINANSYIPVEAQTRAGYILFSVGKKEFLATIAKAQDNLSVLKVTPANNSYYFASDIINNMFHFIANTLQTEVVSIQKAKE